MDDGQRRPALGAGRRRPPRPRAGRLLRLVARQGRPRRRRAVRHRPGRRRRHRRRRRAARAASPTASSTTRCGPTSTSSSASSRPASTWSARRRSSTAGASAPTATASSTACEQGGSSMFGTGISPGLRRADRHRHRRHLRPHRQDHDRRGVRHHALRLARHRAARAASAGRSTTPSCPGMAAEGTAVFGEAVAMVADALGVELDEIVCEAEYAQTTEDVVMDSWTIAAGLRRRRRRQLAGQGRRPHRRRAQRPVEEGPDPRARLDDRGGPRHPGRRPAHRDGAGSSTCRRPTSRPPRSPTSWCSG